MLSRERMGHGVLEDAAKLPDPRAEGERLLARPPFYIFARGSGCAPLDGACNLQAARA
jgi:hypothetical protein